MKESEILTAVRLRLGQRMDTVVWRNSTGALFEATCPHCHSTFRLERPQRFGLCVGSSDLIGLHKGRFLAVETKSPRGRLTADQGRFLGLVSALGGIALCARGDEEAEAEMLRQAESQKEK